MLSEQILYFALYTFHTLKEMKWEAGRADSVQALGGT